LIEVNTSNGEGVVNNYFSGMDAIDV